jgi:hypothetical protein
VLGVTAAGISMMHWSEELHRFVRRSPSRFGIVRAYVEHPFYRFHIAAIGLMMAVVGGLLFVVIVGTWLLARG